MRVLTKPQKKKKKKKSKIYVSHRLWRHVNSRIKFPGNSQNWKVNTCKTCNEVQRDMRRKKSLKIEFMLSLLIIQIEKKRKNKKKKGTQRIPQKSDTQQLKTQILAAANIILAHEERQFNRSLWSKFWTYVGLNSLSRWKY